MIDTEQIKTAEFHVERTRSRLVATLNELSRQLEPHRLVQEAWEKAKDKGADLAEEAVDAVSRRPIATGAVVAGIVAFLARHALIDAAGRAVAGAKNKSKRRRKAPREEKTEAAE